MQFFYDGIFHPAKSPVICDEHFFKHVTYSVIIRQVENFLVIRLGILTGQNGLLVPHNIQYISYIVTYIFEIAKWIRSWQ